jgi:hypothetical protein
VDFNNLRPLLKNNLAAGVIEMLHQYNENSEAAYKRTDTGATLKLKQVRDLAQQLQDIVK